MPELAILLDTNAYLRLAKSIHPLLNIPICNGKYRLFIIADLQLEFNRSSTLKHKFHWVNEKIYTENRQGATLRPSRAEKLQIERATPFITRLVRNGNYNLSPEDIKALAYAVTLKIPIVTDDEQMLVVSKVYSIKRYKTIELLKLMFDNSYIDLDKLKEIVSYWQYCNDKPKNLRIDYLKLFKEELPDE